jgi:hypothetical protein
MVCRNQELTAMPKVVHLHLGMVDLPAHVAALTETAALHELVLIATQDFIVGSRLADLRQALAPRLMVALLIDDDLPPIEKALVDDLLNDGVIPVIVTIGDAPPGALTSWLEKHEPTADSIGHRDDHHRITRPAPRLGSRRRVAPRSNASDLRPAA